MAEGVATKASVKVFINLASRRDNFEPLRSQPNRLNRHRFLQFRPGCSGSRCGYSLRRALQTPRYGHQFILERGGMHLLAAPIRGQLSESARQKLQNTHSRSSSNTGDYIDSEQQAALLQEKNWLDLPKLIEISFLFPIGNAQLVGELVENAIKSQPNVLEEIGIALSYFLSRVGTFYHKCMASFEVLASSPGDEAIIKDQPRKDLLEIEEFIVDAVVMLNCFIQTYKPAAFLFSLPSQISNQTEDLLNLLGRMHDTLFPIFKLEFPRLYEYLHLNSLCDKIVELGRNILVICYLTTDGIGENFGSQPITKLFPAMVDDPATRGDIVFHTLVRVNKEILPCIHHVEGHITFLKSIELKCSLLSRIRILSERGWLFLDDEQFSYLSEIMMPPSIKPGFFEE